MANKIIIPKAEIPLNSGTKKRRGAKDKKSSAPCHSIQKLDKVVAGIKNILTILDEKDRKEKESEKKKWEENSNPVPKGRKKNAL